MLRMLLALLVVASVGLTSCEKTISKKACFTFSKNTAKVNDTIYVFNCSEGYQRCIIPRLLPGASEKLHVFGI